MSNYAVFFLGPAGSGKSTLCAALLEHLQTVGRCGHLANLDPAAVFTKYTPSVDIRTYLSLEKLMDETGLGPNGALIACLEEALQDDGWLVEDLTNREGDFLLVDCPGQIEIHTHFDIISRVMTHFSRNNYKICVVHLLEAHFLQEPTKFIAGTLSALATMLRLETPHINIISKADLLSEEAKEETSDGSISESLEEGTLEGYFQVDPQMLLEKMETSTPKMYQRLSEALLRLVEEYSLVGFFPVSARSSKQIEQLMFQIDNCLQYGEDVEPEDREHDLK